MTTPGPEDQLRQPRLAELVAARLRTRILAGEFTDGGQLPRQEDLLAEFRVSKPSIREALRILETEGLITVRRGNVGGASGRRGRHRPNRASPPAGLTLLRARRRGQEVVDAGTLAGDLRDR